MSNPLARHHPAYFGKLPSRGDFVRSNGDARLIVPLDHWLSQTMELLAGNPRWKLLYDTLPAIDFAFLGARSTLSIAGHLAPSRDASERRFPFIAAIGFENQDPLGFLSNAPARLSTVWARLDSDVRKARSSPDAAPALQTLARGELDVDGSRPGRSDIHDFLAGRHCGDLEALLSLPHRSVDLRRLMIALGLLLRPLSTTPGAVIARGLDLPLPADRAQRNNVATLWMHLIGGFLRRTSLELQILLGPFAGEMRMVVGFQGASAPSLAGTLDPDAADPHNIRIDTADWVDDQLGKDYGLAKLSSYLSQPRLPLDRAIETFREVFLGE